MNNSSFTFFTIIYGNQKNLFIWLKTRLEVMFAIFHDLNANGMYN